MAKEPRFPAGSRIQATTKFGDLLYGQRIKLHQIKPVGPKSLGENVCSTEGASRSGSTLTGAFLTGLEKAAAVRFSFVLSLPAVLLFAAIMYRPLPATTI